MKLTEKYFEKICSMWKYNLTYFGDDFEQQRGLFYKFFSEG